MLKAEESVDVLTAERNESNPKFSRQFTYVQTSGALVISADIGVCPQVKKI